MNPFHFIAAVYHSFLHGLRHGEEDLSRKRVTFGGIFKLPIIYWFYWMGGMVWCFFRALFLAVGEAWRACRYREKTLAEGVVVIEPRLNYRVVNWQFWFLGLVAAVVVGWGVVRFVQSFRMELPGWLNENRRCGSSLDTRRQPDLPWNRLKDLMGQVEIMCKSNKKEFGAVQLLVFENDPQKAVMWTVEKVVNPGFNPMHQIERSLGIPPGLFVGYYTVAGKAMPFTVKTVTKEAKKFGTTIELKKPLAPGESMVMIRLEKQMKRARLGKDGKHGVGLGRMPEDKVHARGVCLPEGALLAGCNPQGGAITFTNGVGCVAWVNVSLENSKAPLSLTFSMPK
ncbi:MAG: hypothetical protein PHV34_06375 [Verrucomicrobiae bacterium]|nr:hypothetical protein [Verrucomicrobiae bacterium]